jgi:hypothetical protein
VVERDSEFDRHIPIFTYTATVTAIHAYGFFEESNCSKQNHCDNVNSKKNSSQKNHCDNLNSKKNSSKRNHCDNVNSAAQLGD